MIKNTWIWAPQLPFGGDVTQDIAPDTDWFFGRIPPAAGVAQVEKAVFHTASYGRQLGLILDVLMPLIGEAPSDTDEARLARERLAALYRQIEDCKSRARAGMEADAVALLKRMQEHDPDMLARVLGQFSPLTDEDA